MAPVTENQPQDIYLRMPHGIIQSRSNLRHRRNVLEKRTLAQNLYLAPLSSFRSQIHCGQSSASDSPLPHVLHIVWNTILGLVHGDKSGDRVSHC